MREAKEVYEEEKGKDRADYEDGGMREIAASAGQGSEQVRPRRVEGKGEGKMNGADEDDNPVSAEKTLSRLSGEGEKISLAGSSLNGKAAQAVQKTAKGAAKSPVPGGGAGLTAGGTASKTTAAMAEAKSINGATQPASSTKAGDALLAKNGQGGMSVLSGVEPGTDESAGLDGRATGAKSGSAGRGAADRGAQPGLGTEDLMTPGRLGARPLAGGGVMRGKSLSTRSKKAAKARVAGRGRAGKRPGQGALSGLKAGAMAKKGTLGSMVAGSRTAGGAEGLADLLQIDESGLSGVQNESGTGATAPGTGTGGRGAEGLLASSTLQNGGPAEVRGSAMATALRGAVGARRAELMEKAAKGVLMSISRARREVTIDLEPRELGRMKIKVSLHDRLVRAHFVVDHPDVMALLNGEAAGLREHLSRQGFMLSGLEVALGQNENMAEAWERPADNGQGSERGWEGARRGGGLGQARAMGAAEAASAVKRAARMTRASGLDLFV